MRKTIKSIIKDNDGQALIVFALILSVLLGFAALTVDIGAMQLDKTKMQVIADAAALAGAQDLPNDASKAKNTAIEYAILNGAPANIKNNEEIDGYNVKVVSPFNGDESKIEVTVTKEVVHFFAKALGFDKSKVSVRAVGQKTSNQSEVSENSPFGYAIFSGSTDKPVVFQGISLNVNGDVFSNKKILFTNMSGIVSGSLSAAAEIEIPWSGSVRVGGNISAPKVEVKEPNLISKVNISSIPVINMPDFSEIWKKEAMAAGQFYKGNIMLDGGYTRPISIEDVYIKNRDKNIPTFIDGDLTIKNGQFVDKGKYLVTGDINISGVKFGTTSTDSVAFYSLKNLSLNLIESNIHGVFYAPNGKINAKDLGTLYGRLVANEVELTNSNYNIITSDSDLDLLPPFTSSGQGSGDGGVRLVE